MARPVKYKIDSQNLLQLIWQGTIGRRAELEQQRAALPPGADGWHDYQWMSREIQQCDWALYPSSIVEPGATEGERRATLRAVLALEDAGLVRGSGDRLTAIQLTPEGLASIKRGATNATAP